MRIRSRRTSGTKVSIGAMIGRASTFALLACCALLLALPAGARPHPAAAATGAQSLPLKLPATTDTTTWTIVLVLTLLTILPALLLSMTPFVRIIIVFHFLRQALGTQTAPSNQTLLGLGLFLTYFVMQPVAAQIGQVAVAPLERHEIAPMDALERASTPLRNFMLKFTREKDLALLTELAHIPRPREPEDLPMRVVIPAYILSEMKAGFQIGAVLYLPFMVVDMVVAAVTTSVGMMQLPPVIISTPLKILLFVVADGWNLVVGSLLKSFY